MWHGKGDLHRSVARGHRVTVRYKSMGSALTSAWFQRVSTAVGNPFPTDLKPWPGKPQTAMQSIGQKSARLRETHMSREEVQTIV
jgi:hypothetical protein